MIRVPNGVLRWSLLAAISIIGLAIVGLPQVAVVLFYAAFVGLLIYWLALAASRRQ